jgi:hypothetical protein
VQLLNLLVDLDETLCGDNGIKTDINDSKLSVSVSPTNNLLSRLIVFHEIWYGVNAIQGDPDVIILNPIASIILILLRFKFVR